MTDLKIPGFEMIEKLGQGGMATVWKARQISLDRIVAIKILSSHLAYDPADVQRFQGEAQQAAKLKHPGIIQVYDASVEKGVYYFVMEYVAGYTAGDWVRRKGMLSEKDALLVGECVADALDYAWQNARIIHCDIKPDNIIIDSDGTVKVADLGLSRTINAMSSKKADEEVMGTPAYISPEQAMGQPDLDCRADIYSLGAMMYHLVTGKLLFEGNTDDKVMELQVTGTVPDPLEFNPKLSKSLCWMIEKMLAKKREDRHKDWPAVRADLARVKKGLPILNPPADGASTVSRSTKRLKVVASHTSTTEEVPKGMPLVARVALAAVVVVIAAFALSRLNPKQPAPEKRPGATVASAVVPAKTTPTTGAPSDTGAKEMFEFAKQWTADNPGQYDEALGRFQKVVEQTRGTPFALMAEDEIRRVATLKQNETDKVMKRLADQTAALIREEKFVEAAGLYEGYAGPMASDTQKKRAGIAADLKASKERVEEAKRKKELRIESKMVEFLDRVVTDLTVTGVDEALKSVTAAMGDEELARKEDAIKTIKSLLDDVAMVDQKILQSFKVAPGQDISVQLNDGVKKFSVVDVREGKVFGQQKLDSAGGTATIPVVFEAKDLSARERLLRMGSEESQNDVALVKGVMALNSKAYPHARKYFGMTHPLLADRLVARVDVAEKKQANDEAQTALCLIMKMLGIPADQYKAEAWLEALAQKKIGADLAPKIIESIHNFRNKYGDTTFAREAEPVVLAIENACAGSSGEGGRSGVQPQKPVVLPSKLAEIVGDKDAILDRLYQRNPELNPKEVNVTTEDGGKVVRVEIASDGLVDIGPVAAFKDLREFSCGAVLPQNMWRTEPPCKLGDVSALRGLPLESLFVGVACVRDLAPVRGMPLRVLRVRNCPISDLAPVKDVPTLEDLMVRNTEIKDVAVLKGLKLKRLDIAGTRVFDLKPLSGMPLEFLDVSDSQVKDITVVKDMPLTSLNLARTRIFNFSVLKGLPLRLLNVDETQFKDFALLKGLPLKELHLANTGLADASVLKGLPLSALSLAGSIAKDYSAIADMQLHFLDLSGSRVEDISFLKDMPLETLDISNTKVSDLSPLKELKLTRLNITGSRVKDLRPIAELPLTRLQCQNIPAANFEPLRRMPIRSLCIDDPEGPVKSILRGMPDLEEVNWVQVNRR